MTTKTPEALAVLDAFLYSLCGTDGVTGDELDKLAKARAALAELMAASEELRGVSMVFGQSRPIKIVRANNRIYAALAAVEVLPK